MYISVVGSFVKVVVLQSTAYLKWNPTKTFAINLTKALLALLKDKKKSHENLRKKEIACNISNKLY